MLVSGANQLYPNIKYKLKKIKFRTAKKYHQQWNILSFIKKIIYFLTVLGLYCCLQAFSNCCQQELLFLVVRRLLNAGAAFIAEHRP